MNKQELTNNGFEGFIPASSIGKDIILPNSSGIYAVLIPANYETSALKDNKKWVVGAEIIYIGRTRDLNARINLIINQQYNIQPDKRFGLGVNEHTGRSPKNRKSPKNKTNRADKLIWGMTDQNKLLFAWKEVHPDFLKDEESELLQEFSKAYGKFPFANIATKFKNEVEGQIDTIRMMSHNINPVIFQLHETIDTVYLYLKNKGLLSDSVLETEEISFEDFNNSVQKETVQSVMERMKKYCERITNNIKSANKMVSLEFDKEDFDIYNLKNLLEEYLETKKSEFPDITFTLNVEDWLLCVINSNSFYNILDQLIENSAVHGFKNYEIKDKKIKIEAYYDYGNTIKFSNNGRKFELTEEDYFRLGSKGNHSKGLGFGGSYIKNVIKMHGGKIRIKSKNGWTEFVINLPYPNIGGSK
ncbi:ATP-binding protein [Clostridium sp.]|uniref:ATP-binding protein n=1 Tax=Clostridium sp. TaxID=1506 RepID=UPI002847420A|nr:ATP-binding protein [Clostridium sp.]MDR3596512.1 ATP-binding protein [Clostridium sp.]